MVAGVGGILNGKSLHLFCLVYFLIGQLVSSHHDMCQMWQCNAGLGLAHVGHYLTYP